MKILGAVLFLILCLVLMVAGALQCFAPRTRRELEKRFRVKADWSASAGGKYFEDLADRNAINPSLNYRLGGVALMVAGICMFAAVILRLLK